MAAMRRIVVVLSTALAIAAAPGLEAPASALSCAGPLPGTPLPDPYDAGYDAIVEGVALSGPSDVDGSLDSPARFLVTKWIRGSGPRIVPVGTAVFLSVGPHTGHTPGFFQPKPGRVARLFADRDRFGILHDAPCLLHDPRPRPRSPLRRVAGSDVRAAAGPAAWRAHAQRGGGGLHCVVLHPERRHTGGGKECEASGPLLAVHHEGDRDRVRSTAVVLAGRGIREARLTTPDGPIVLRSPREGSPLLAVLLGRVDAAEVRGRVVLDNGRVRWLRPAGFPTTLVPDPELGRPWRSAFDDGFSFTFSRAVSRSQCVGAHQLAPRTGSGGGWLGTDAVCGDLRRDPYFFAVERPAPETLERGVEPQPLRTVVVGAARPSVSEIVVRDPAGERRLLRGPGGHFAAVYPASVSAGQLEVTMVFRDGSTITHRGRAGVNLRR
jgi:hypothetical protein